MVLLAKNYHYTKNSNNFFLIFFSIFLAGPGSGRLAPGPGSRAGPGNIEKHGKNNFFLAGPGYGPASGISVLRILLTNGNPSIDPRSTGSSLDHPRIDPKSTPDHPRSTPDRPQIAYRSTRDRPQIDPKPPLTLGFVTLYELS